jgi:hypothetical protein
MSCLSLDTADDTIEHSGSNSEDKFVGNGGSLGGYCMSTRRVVRAVIER